MVGMGNSPVAFALLLSLSCAQQKTDVVLLAVEGAVHSDIKAIRKFLEKEDIFRVRVLRPGETEPPAAGQPVVYWLHLPDSISYAQWMRHCFPIKWVSSPAGPK